MSRSSILLVTACLCACVPGDGETDDTADDTSCDQTVVVTLDDVPDASEGATWTEDGVTLTLLANDQGGFNANHVPDTGCLWLFIGTRLVVEPSCATATAEIDTIDYCGGNCVQAKAFEGSTEVASANSAAGNDPQTLVLDGGGAMLQTIEIAGLESPICEIRLEP